MSWSFSAIGKPLAVLAKARKDLTASKCPEPEETVKGKLLDALDAALTPFPADYAVKVEAYGSQSSGGAGPTNSFSMKVEPIYGFVQ